MEQWFEGLSCTAVTWVQFPNLGSPVGLAFYCFLSLLQGFLSRTSSFPLYTEANVPNFNLTWKQWTKRATQPFPKNIGVHFKFCIIGSCSIKEKEEESRREEEWQFVF